VNVQIVFFDNPARPHARKQAGSANHLTRRLRQGPKKIKGAVTQIGGVFALHQGPAAGVQRPLSQGECLFSHIGMMPPFEPIGCNRTDSG
jgi:hypothetical protein